MRTYRVTITREARQEFSFEVGAEDAASAKDEAESLMNDFDDEDWDFVSESSDREIDRIVDLETEDEDEDEDEDKTETMESA